MITHDEEPRWRRRPEERPAQILEAALAVFGEKGVAGARLEDIADRAGISKGTVYLYFENKHELFAEVLREWSREVLEQVHEPAAHTAAAAPEAAPAAADGDAAAAEGDATAADGDAAAAEGDAAEAAIGAFAARYWALLRSPRFATIQRLVASEIQSFPELAREYGRDVRRPLEAHVRGLLERGVAAGVVEPGDHVVRARMLLALLLQHALWCARREFHVGLADRSDEQVFRDVMDFYLGAVRVRSRAGSRGGE